MASVAASEVGGVLPDVGEGHLGEVSCLHVGHDVIERLADARHLRGTHAVDVHLRRYALDLPRGRATG